MNAISKVSAITVSDIAEYIRLDEVTNDDENTLTTLLNVATEFISSYTGHTTEELDDYPTFVIAVLLLCQDMWDNRALYDNGFKADNLNKTVETILGMHSVNLL